MKKYILVDIDGTISEIGDRIKYLNVDWDKFYETALDDKPNTEMCNIVGILSGFYQIIFVTGRSEMARKVTSKWIEKNFPSLKYSLLMRKDGDERDNPIVKLELIKENNISLDDIETVIDDDSSVIEMWTENGIKCLQVK